MRKSLWPLSHPLGLRRLNWIRRSRAALSLQDKSKDLGRLHRKLLRSGRHFSHAPIFYAYSGLVRPPKESHIVGARFKARCAFTGASRGLRFSLSRMSNLSIAFGPHLGSMGIGRWVKCF